MSLYTINLTVSDHLPEAVHNQTVQYGLHVFMYLSTTVLTMLDTTGMDYLL